METKEEEKIYKTILALSQTSINYYKATRVSTRHGILVVTGPRQKEYSVNISTF